MENTSGNLVLCVLEAPAFSKQQNGPVSFSKLVRSKWYKIKLKKTYSRIIDDKVSVTLQLGLNPNFVISIKRSEDELFREWKSNNPTKFLFDVELDESDGGRTEIIRQSEEAVKFNWNQKKQEIKLKIRFNCESEQFLINQDVKLDAAFLLSVAVSAQSTNLQDSASCQVKIYENFQSHIQNQIEISPITKLERQIQLERYENIDMISHVVPEAEARVVPVQSFSPKTNTWNVSTVAQISIAIFLIAICLGFFVQWQQTEFQKQIKLLESKLDNSKLNDQLIKETLERQKLQDEMYFLKTKFDESKSANSKMNELNEKLKNKNLEIQKLHEQIKLLQRQLDESKLIAKAGQLLKENLQDQKNQEQIEFKTNKSNVSWLFTHWFVISGLTNLIRYVLGFLAFGFLCVIYDNYNTGRTKPPAWYFAMAWPTVIVIAISFYCNLIVLIQLTIAWGIIVAITIAIDDSNLKQDLQGNMYVYISCSIFLVLGNFLDASDYIRLLFASILSLFFCGGLVFHKISQNVTKFLVYIPIWGSLYFIIKFVI